MAIVVFAALVLFPVGYAIVTVEQRPAIALPMPDAKAYRVFVVDWGYHTAVVVEQPTGWRLGPAGDEAAPFLEYAWGDRRFYFASDYRPHAVFATLFLPTASVVYLDGHPDPPRFDGARAVFTRTVDAGALRVLMVELERSIQHVDGRRVAPYARAGGYGGRFYPAHGAYLWTRDCNWWTVARLRGAQLAGSPAGVLFSSQVRRRLRGFVAAGPAA